jgi:hypothetical protein
MEIECVFDQFPKCHMNILLGGFNVIIRRKDIFKPKIRNENLHDNSNVNGLKVVNFATSEDVSRVQCSHITAFINTLDFS